MEIPSSLVGGMDCSLHYHSSDRVPTHDTLKRLQQLKNVISVSSHYTALKKDDIILVDTTSSGITVTLPLASNGIEFTIIRIAGANSVTVARSGSDTINGAASVNITSTNAPQTFKAMPPDVVVGYIRVA